MSARRHLSIVIAFVAVASVAALYFAPRHVPVPQRLPDRLSDSEFWNLINEVSETGGYFRSDNFVSNESTYQDVIPELTKRVTAGGVYLGVGPDQNFTYIAALHPRLAFIIDIRRQNMLLHLMYKALFELSADRVEFLSRLFSRAAPPKAPRNDSAEHLFEIFHNEQADSDLAKQNFEAIIEDLQDRHHFSVSIEDARSMEYVYNSFVSAGPEIRYSYPNQYAWRRFPSYSELMLETDDTGHARSYMASEENFQTVKALESDNRIVPVVGDFSGDKTVRTVGRYIRQHGGIVAAFYTSNVEFYLFQTEDWKKFFNNVGELPIDNSSIFVRAYFNNYGLRFPNTSGARSVTLLDSMRDLMSSFNAGHIHSYFDLIKRSTQP